MIDAHCHVDLYARPTDIAQRAERAKVLTVMVTNLPTAFEKAYPYVKDFSQIRIALGLHPLLASQHAIERPRFQQLIDKTSYIGEVGLDFSGTGRETKVEQIKSFKFVLATIANRRKFVTVHSRRAESELLDILEDAAYSFPVVFHWYSGPLNVLDRAVGSGHFFSINPAMAISPNGKKIIDRIPPNRVLTETDGPFVKIGSKIVEPSDVTFVEQYLASNWSMPNHSVRQTIRENFMSLVRPIRIIKK